MVGRVCVLTPHPLVAVRILDRVSIAAAGQGVWAGRMAALLGADVVLCGFAGGATGAVVAALLDEQGLRARLTPTSAESGRYVQDAARDDQVVAATWSGPATQGETCALLADLAEAVRDADVLVVTNPMPGDALSWDVYPAAVRAGHDAGARVLVDLSSPRLDAALAAHPCLVKLNDWELAESVAGPVARPAARDEALQSLLRRGAGFVVLTSGPGEVVARDRDGTSWTLHPPDVGQGVAAGCGDAMTGAMAAALAAGQTWPAVLTTGVAAGAAHHRSARVPVTAAGVADLAAAIRRAAQPGPW